MRKFAFVVFFVIGLICQLFGQAVDDNTIIQSSAKSWPAGPYSQVVTNYGVLNTSIPLISLDGMGQTSLNLALVHRSYTFGNDSPIYNCGRGWSHTGINSITTTNGYTRVSANRATGSWEAIAVGNAFVYTRKPGVRDDLEPILTGGFKVTDYETKNVYFYERSVSSNVYDLTKMVDPFGNQVTYTYIGNTRNLFRITDASGRYIEFTYGGANNANLVSKIHLQCGGYFREWDLGYEDVQVGTGLFNNYYLGKITFPSPNAASPRPTIDLDSDAGARITYLRTFSDGSTLGKLWGYSYAETYAGSTQTGVSEVHPPLKSSPGIIDPNNFTTFTYNRNGSGLNVNDELVCTIKDPMGFKYKHIYYNYATQNTTDFPFPIKRVEDPITKIYSNPRSNQTPIDWLWTETYRWIPSEGVCDLYTDREGVATSYTYWGGSMANRGRVSTKTVMVSGVAHSDSYEYYNSGIKHGKVSSYTDPQGTLTNYTYDDTTGALKQTALDPAGQNITKNYLYNGSGEVTEEWVGSDPHTYYSNFDVYGNALTITPPTASATTMTYDDFNNRTSVAEPSPKGTTTYSYDYWNRQIRTTFPDSNYVENTYDYESNLIDVRNEDGSHRTVTYNYLSLPKTTTVQVDGVSANNLVTTMDYDYNGRQTSIVAPDGLTTTFLYNARGNLIKTTYSDDTNRQAGYDGNGNVVWRQNGRDNLTYYFYDDLNRLTSIDYQSSGTPDVSFGYRKDGLRTSRTDQMGTTTWTYNNAKQLTSYYDAATTKTITYTYQAGTGRPTSTVAPGNTWNYYYDSATRPEYTTQTVSGEIARFHYKDDGSLDWRKAPNNTIAEYSYDTRGRITKIRHAVTSLNQTQGQVGYTYTNGNVSLYTLAIQGGASYSTAYVHDYASRLLSEIRTDSTSLNGFSKSYVYTKGNDRASTTKNGTTSNYTYFAGANRFKSGEGYTVNTYDTDGNPTSITVPGGATWTLSYDEDSRLTQILKPGGNCYFKYNGDGQRVERMTSTSTYRYLLNGDSVLLTTTTGPTYVVQAYYSPGIGYFNGGQMHFYQENALGSALVVRDAAGNWESLTEYDAYGGEYAINGTQKSDFRFAGAHGYLKDDDTGMDLLGARYYLPVLGRFLNQDPIGLNGGLNLYAYCDNGPLSRLDPDGKDWMKTVTKYSNQFKAGMAATKAGFEHAARTNGDGLEWSKEFFGNWVSGQVNSNYNWGINSDQARWLRGSWIEMEILGHVRSGDNVVGKLYTYQSAGGIAPAWRTFINSDNVFVGLLGSVSYQYRVEKDGFITYTLRNTMGLNSFLNVDRRKPIGEASGPFRDVKMTIRSKINPTQW